MSQKTMEQAQRAFDAVDYEFRTAYAKEMDKLGDVEGKEVREARAFLKVPQELRDRRQEALEDLNVARLAVEERWVAAHEDAAALRKAWAATS